MRKSEIVIASISIIASVLMTGSTFSRELKDVRLAMGSKSMVSSRHLVAEELGLFEKHGLKPRFIYMDSSSSAATALIGGSADFAVTGITEAISAQSRGQNMVILAANYTGFSGSLVLSKTRAERLGVGPDAPIADRLRALDGLLIASISPTSNLTVTYKSASSAYGATPRFTFVAMAAMVAALESGAVDGFIATAPIWALPIVRGSGVLWISAPKAELPAEYSAAMSGGVLAMRDFAEANPEITSAMAAVYEEQAKVMRERPGEVRAILAKLFPELESSTLNLVYSLEANAIAARPIKVEDIAHEIGLMKISGAQLGAERLDAAALLWAGSR